MRCPALHGPLWVLAGEKSVDQSRGKGVAAADTIVDFQILASGRLIELAIVIANCSPVIDGRGPRVSQRSRDDRQARKLLNYRRNHFLEVRRIQVGVAFIETSYGETQRRGK